MILLDTDHISILQFDSEAADALKQRLIAAKQPIATTVITLEEHARAGSLDWEGRRLSTTKFLTTAA